MVQYMTKRYRTNLYQWTINTVERLLSIKSHYSHQPTVDHTRVIINMAEDIIAYVFVFKSGHRD